MNTQFLILNFLLFKNPEYFLLEWTNTESGTRGQGKQQTSRIVIRNLLFAIVGFEGKLPLENDILMHDINFFKILKTDQVVVDTAYYDGHKLYKHSGIRQFLQILLLKK